MIQTSFQKYNFDLFIPLFLTVSCWVGKVDVGGATEQFLKFVS